MSDRTEQVVVDVPCVGCGYDLRTQDAEGRCPECGARVRWSLDETIMGWGNTYLHRLAAYARWAAVSALAVPVLLVGVAYLPRMVGLLLGAATSVPLDGFACLGVVLAYAAAMTHVVAVWRCAAAAPGTTMNRHQVLIRLGALMFLGVLAAPLVSFVVANSDDREELQYLQCVFPLLILGLALYPMQGAELLADLSRRAGEKGLAGLAMWGLWVFSAGVVLLDGLVVLSFLPAVSRGRGAAALSYVAAALGIGGGVLTLAGLVGAAIGLLRFSRRMRALAQEAPVAGAALTAVLQTADDADALGPVGNPWLK